jgi:hypothetical protein
MNNIEFNPLEHTYKLGGRLIDNVTTILESEGFSDFSMIPENVLTQAQERGSDVHDMALYLIQNRLDESTIDEVYLGYLNAIKAFLRDYNIKIIETEKIVYSKTWDFVGKLDFLFQYNDELILIDWKTSTVISKSTDIQLSAYKIAWEENKKSKQKIKKIWCVQLQKNGKYKIFPCKNEKHVFLAAVQNYKWKRRNLK